MTPQEQQAYLRLSMLHSEALLRIQDLEAQLARKSWMWKVAMFFRRNV